MTTTTAAIRSGDTVSFYGRGKQIVGVVGRIRTRRRRSLASKLRAFVDDEDHIADMTEIAVAEVVPAGASDNYWTVPVSRLTLVAKHAGRPLVLPEAAGTLREIKAENKRRRAARFQQRVESSGVDLWRLPPGAAIEIQFRDVGWQRATFVCVTKAGLVRFSRHGRARSVPPKFVRRVSE